MSEYQFYEFQAIDRPLTPQEQDKIDALSSRVELTPTSAIFTYNYSDFPADAEQILARYFDAMLYTSNFGSRQLMFRFPGSLVKAAELKPFCLEDAIQVRTSGKYLTLNIRVDEEPSGEWIEGPGMLTPLLPLRQSLIEKDYRALYLAWLKCAEVSFCYDGDEDAAGLLEPPVPPNLGKLTPPLRALIDFLELDDTLVKVAAQGSQALPTLKPVEYESLLDQLPEAERQKFLVRLLRGESNLTQQLQQRLLKLRSVPPSEKKPAASPRRTFSDLFKEAEDWNQRREKSKTPTQGRIGETLGSRRNRR